MVRGMQMYALGEDTLMLRFGGNNSHIVPRYGIRDYGPFRSPKENRVILRFAYPSKDTALKTLVGIFKDTLIQGGHKFPGFQQMYRLNDVEVLEDVCINSKDLFRPSESTLANIVDEDRTIAPIPIYIVIIPPYPRWYHESPYYILKAFLLKHGILSQMLRTVTLKRGRNTIEETAFNVANAIFAKAGGEPWRLWSHVPSFSGKTDDVLLIGMGISKIPLEPGQKEFYRYVGFTIAYSSEGQLLLIKTSVQEYEKQAVLKKMLQVLREIIQTFGTRRHSIDVIIHYSGKELSHEEETAIQEQLRECQKNLDVEINYAILRIIRDVSYRIALENRYGYPPMASYMNIGERLILIYTNGELRGMTPLGVPRPLLVSIRSSNLHLESIDRVALTRSVTELSRMNWRGTGPFNREPVTIKYSRLSAYLAAAFKEIAELSPEALPHDLPWFL